MRQTADELLAHYLRKWTLLADGNPITTPRAHLYPVLYKTQELILKILSDESDEQYSAAALQHYDGDGAVEVIMADEGAVLMVCSKPATALCEFRKVEGDAAATQVAAHVLKRLHSKSVAAKSGFPSLKYLGNALTNPVVTNAEVLPGDMLVRAGRLLENLLETASPQKVLHGDLHHENIILDAQLGWLAIDPKGLVGDPVYDCAALLKNPLDDPGIANPDVILSRAHIFESVLGYPRERILQWGYVHAVLSVAWSIEDSSDIGPALAVAHTLHELV